MHYIKESITCRIDGDDDDGGGGGVGMVLEKLLLSCQHPGECIIKLRYAI